jgi:signal transduction histidine kinase
MRRRFANLPIHAKLLVPFAILMILWGGFGTAIVAHGSASESRARATARLATAFDGARAVLGDEERNLLGTVRLTSNTQGVALALRARNAATLRALLEPVAFNEGHDRLRVVDRSGAVILSVDVASKTVLREPPMTIPAVLRGARGEADVRGDKFAELTADELIVAGPVRDASGAVIGAVVVSDRTVSMVARMGRATGTRVVMFARDGSTLAANGGPLPFHASSTGVHRSVASAGDSMEAVYGPLTLRGERAGYVAVALPSSVLLAGMQGKGMLLALLVGVAVLVALMVGNITARGITKPIGALVDATRSLERGDLHVRAPISSKDEIGALASSFNAMAAELESSHRELEQNVADRTAQLRQANAELSRISSAKSAFLASLSHELRTPLNGVIGFADMLSDPTFGDYSPEETREIAGNILTSGRHLLHLINDLLDLAKIEAGKIDVKPETTDVASIIEEVDTVLSPLARDKQIALHALVSSRLPHATADPGRLRQVLLNLVSNAIKFTPDGGSVRIAAVREGDFLKITVSDTGLGVAQADVERIFQPYERGDAGRDIEGAGLGLAVARLLIELQGGRIWVEETSHRGSTFAVAVPLAPSTTEVSR